MLISQTRVELARQTGLDPEFVGVPFAADNPARRVSAVYLRLGEGMVILHAHCNFMTLLALHGCQPVKEMLN